MKALAAVVIFLTLLCFGLAQTPIAATNGIAASEQLNMTNRPNLVTISNAVKIASGLRIGMTWADADKYLLAHGMGQTNIYSMSMDRGHTLDCPYPLTGVATNVSLVLAMECSQPPASGLFGWKNPLLKGAYIQSNGVNIIFITLTNTP
jgi:hypothetical protein